MGSGVFEIGCGLPILVGLPTRLAIMPMIIDMLGAPVGFSFMKPVSQGSDWQSR